jgi:hypothetical protein
MRYDGCSDLWPASSSRCASPSVRDKQEAYLARIGRLFLDAPADVLEKFILNRRNLAGSNLHAAALARMRSDRLPREKLAEWGRRASTMGEASR